MCGVIDTRAVMTKKLQMVGYVDACLKKDCILGKVGENIHAHEFHFSTAEEVEENIFDCVKMRTSEKYSAGWANENIVASYLHIHFKGCPNVAKNFVESCRKFSEGDAVF